MTDAGSYDVGRDADGGSAQPRAMAPPIAAAPDESTAVNHPPCSDQSCYFYQDPPDDGDLPKAPASSRASTDPPTSSGLSPTPSMDTPEPVTTAPSPGSPPTTYTYSRSAAVAYALKWATSTNPDYERFMEDCTNFVSQALLAGGWPMITPGDVCADPKDPTVWWFRRDACFHLLARNTHCSWTWGVAAHLFKFLCNSGRATPLEYIRDLEPGDILQKDYGDDYIKHTLIVTEKTVDNLYFASHTLDYPHQPFWGPGGILRRNSPCNWYAFHIK